MLTSSVLAWQGRGPAQGRCGTLAKNRREDFRYEDLLVARLQTLAGGLARLVARDLQARHGLTLNEWRLLANIGVDGGTTAQEIVARTGIDKGWVSRSAAALEGRGLIERLADPKDTRKRRLRLTDAGEALYTAAIATTRQTQSRLIQGFSADEHQSLVRAISRLQHDLDSLLDGNDASR